MIDEDVIRVKNRADLKRIAYENRSPCATCVQSEGCPAPAYCEEYQRWLKNAKRIHKPGKKKVL